MTNQYQIDCFTLSEAAEQLGVTRQAVHKMLTRNPTVSTIRVNPRLTLITPGQLRKLARLCGKELNTNV